MRMSGYGRGRPRGPWRSMADMTSFAYLIMISKKCGIVTDRLFECFQDAWANKKVLYKTMSIECREKTENDAIFLVMQNKKVIAQFRLNNGTLRSLRKVDCSRFQFEESIPVKKVETLKAIAMQIKDLNVETKLVNLKAMVIEKSISRTAISRFGDALLVSTAIISDDTGSTKLTLWNSQIDAISVGDAIQIENGQVKTFRGELQVSLGRRGKLHVNEKQTN